MDDNPAEQVLYWMLGGLGHYTELILQDPANAAEAPSLPALFASLVYKMNEAGIAPNERAQEVYGRVLREL